MLAFDIIGHPLHRTKNSSSFNVPYKQFLAYLFTKQKCVLWKKIYISNICTLRVQNRTIINKATNVIKLLTNVVLSKCVRLWHYLRLPQIEIYYLSSKRPSRFALTGFKLFTAFRITKCRFNSVNTGEGSVGSLRPSKVFKKND